MGGRVVVTFGLSSSTSASLSHQPRHDIERRSIQAIQLGIKGIDPSQSIFVYHSRRLTCVISPIPFPTSPSYPCGRVFVTEVSKNLLTKKYQTRSLALITHLAAFLAIQDFQLFPLSSFFPRHSFSSVTIRNKHGRQPLPRSWRLLPP